MAILIIRGASVVTETGLEDSLVWVNRATGRIIAPSRADESLEADGLWLYPGLINAHEHLEFNHYPRSRPQGRYQNAQHWAHDMTVLHDQEPFMSLRHWPLEKRCWVGGIKNLMVGATFVAHHNHLHAILKSPPPEFPVRVYQPYGWAHSLYLTPLWRIITAYHRTLRGKFFVHLAEGTDGAAQHELRTLQHWGLLTPKTVLIHGVGLEGASSQQAIAKSGGLVWCPSSNLYLLGQTASVKAWYAAGKLALGSDSLLTADGTLLDELRAAYQTGQLSAQELFHSVTAMAAQVLGMPDRGGIAPGYHADLLALYPAAHGDPYRALIESEPAQIAWVMQGGVIRWRQHPQGIALWGGIRFQLAEPLAQTLQALGLAQIVQLGFELSPGIRPK
jgi:hypothetical protein